MGKGGDGGLGGGGGGNGGGGTGGSGGSGGASAHRSAAPVNSSGDSDRCAKKCDVGDRQVCTMSVMQVSV